MEEELQSISNNFDKLEDGINITKKQISKFDVLEKIDLNTCHIAISPNGGFIAICGKRGFLDISKDSKLNDNILIMSQDSTQKYYIPIAWDSKKKYMICFEFNEDEKLYGIFNDGTIYKFDIVLKKAVHISSSKRLENDKIIYYRS